MAELFVPRVPAGRMNFVKNLCCTISSRLARLDSAPERRRMGFARFRPRTTDDNTPRACTQQ